MTTRKSRFRFLAHPVAQWVIGLYLAIVLVTYGVAIIRFTPTLADALGSGFANAYGTITGVSSRSFFGGTEYRFQLEGANAVYVVAPGTLSSGATMSQTGAGVAVTHTIRGNWVIELTDRGAAGSPVLVTKQVATQALESAVSLAYARAALSFLAALVFGTLPLWFSRLRARLKKSH